MNIVLQISLFFLLIKWLDFVECNLGIKPSKYALLSDSNSVSFYEYSTLNLNQSHKQYIHKLLL